MGVTTTIWRVRAVSWPPPLTSAGPASSGVVAAVAAATIASILTISFGGADTCHLWHLPRLFLGFCDGSRHCSDLGAHLSVLGGQVDLVSGLKHSVVRGGVEVHIGDVAADS